MIMGRWAKPELSDLRYDLQNNSVKSISCPKSLILFSSSCLKFIASWCHVFWKKFLFDCLTYVAAARLYGGRQITVLYMTAAR